MNYKNSDCDDNLHNEISAISVRRGTNVDYFIVGECFEFSDIIIGAIKPYISGNGVPFLYNILDEEGNILLGVPSALAFIQFKKEG